MPVQIQEIEPSSLPRYAAVPISFQVESVFRVEAIDGGLGGFALVEEQVTPPYENDYDAMDDAELPLDWPEIFDVSRWGIFLALATHPRKGVDGNHPVGGATVAFDTAEVNMLEGRRDLAVLWDIRVQLDERGRGVGSKLFQHAANWARQRGCRQLKIETQNTNVRACRFYAAQGCQLGAIHRYAYATRPQVAHEVMLLWYLDL